MRIILVLIVGFLLAFFLSEALAALRRKLHLPSKHSLPTSFFGAALILLSIPPLLWGSPYLGSANSSLLSIFFLGSGLGNIIHHLLSQNFIFFKKQEQQFVRHHEAFFERLLEILPGFLTWTFLTSPLWLSIFLPFAVAYIIILADIYWLITGLRIAVLIHIGYRKMEKAKKTDWLDKLEVDFSSTWKSYYHLLVIPTYKEGLEVLQPAFDSIIHSDYPKDKIFLGIGLEERDTPEKLQAVQEYAKKNNHKIGGVLVSLHPFGLPGEIAGPATNRNWVVNNALKEFQKRGIKPEQVLVTTLDADFVIHPRFLAGALHKYLSTPVETRNKRSFTGVFLYHNNYWDCPAPMRIISTGTAFWQLSEMVGSDKYINFSSLSINMKSLLDIGLWIPNKVNDDAGFYWKAYYHLHGDYKVIPHFLPITADTVLDINLLKTFQNQYLQLKRWAYGVEHIPFIIKQYFAAPKELDFWDKTDKLIFILWSYTKWGTLAIFITFAGIVVPLINPSYSQSVVSHNQPIISSWVLTAAFIGLFSTIFAHEKTSPPRPKNWSFAKKFWSYIQWALVPLVMVTIASIPAIDAQTRLMLGKYLEYRVTNKARVSA